MVAPLNTGTGGERAKEERTTDPIKALAYFISCKESVKEL